VVLDEADRMLDIGFLPDLQRILSHLPKTRTTLLFSATFSPEIKRLAGSYLQDPVTIEVARPNETASTVEQRFYSVSDDDKRYALRSLLKQREIRQAFVFSNSKLGCARLTRALERDGLRATALHGDKSQDERLKALEAFKRGEVDLLVCTDVAARGLDIKDVPAVFNYDVPFNAEDYVHRIGRTGRAGASGIAVTLVTSHDARLVGEIEKLIKKKINVETCPMEDFRGSAPRGHRFDELPRQGAGGGYGRERDRGGERGDRGADAARGSTGFGHRGSRMAQRPAHSDPFFDKPYEPSASADANWESQRAAPKAGGNIKPKRKLAALFKAPVAPAAPVATSEV
jgi:superfamily II DNA/RNA helicase